MSRHLVEATAKQLKQFQERSLEEFPLFAMYHTVHRGQAFVVALGVDREGKKLPLGFWEGATENHETAGRVGATGGRQFAREPCRIQLKRLVPYLTKETLRMVPTRIIGVMRDRGDGDENQRREAKQ